MLSTPGDTVNEVWTTDSDGKPVARGDVEDWLATKLVKVKIGNWRVLYRHRETSQLWELSYPQSEMHGGGPRRLTCLAITDPHEW